MQYFRTFSTYIPCTLTSSSFAARVVVMMDVWIVYSISFFGGFHITVMKSSWVVIPTNLWNLFMCKLVQPLSKHIFY